MKLLHNLANSISRLPNPAKLIFWTVAILIVLIAAIWLIAVTYVALGQSGGNIVIASILVLPLLWVYIRGTKNRSWNRGQNLYKQTFGPPVRKR
jgi:hypothetical protein